MFVTFILLNLFDFIKKGQEIRNLFELKNEKGSVKRCLNDNLLIVSRVNPQEADNVEVDNVEVENK
jgi:hypothetical protein